MPDNQPAPDPSDQRPVAALMTTTPRTCSPFSTITEAALIFRDEECGVVPVLDAGKPVGVLTDRDVALAVIDKPSLGDLPVGDVMTREVVTIHADETIAAARVKFSEAEVRRLIVVDAVGQLVGILSRADLPKGDELGTLPVSRKSARLEAEVVEAHPHSKAKSHRLSWASPKAFWGLIKSTATEWSEDQAPMLGAALAFYSVLSIAPLLLIAVAVASVVYGEQAASGELADKLKKFVGDQGADAMQTMLQNAHKPGAGPIAAIVGFATLLFAASGVFGQLQTSMNTIWEVELRPGRGILGMVKDRFLSFAMVLGTGFLLLTSLILSTVVSVALNIVQNMAPGLKPLLAFSDTAVSAVVVILLFALIFKVLPDAKIAWRDVWVGAALTTVLFLIGKALIGLYLGRSSYGSAYGAAGSLVILLVWIYYSAQILFFGAEFTQVYANRYGSQIRPKSNAVRVPESKQS